MMRGGYLKLVHLWGVRLVYNWSEGAFLHHAPLMFLLHLLGDQVQLQLLLFLSLLHTIVEAQPTASWCRHFLLYLHLGRRNVQKQDSASLVFL